MKNQLLRIIVSVLGIVCLLSCMDYNNKKAWAYAEALPASIQMSGEEAFEDKFLPDPTDPDPTRPTPDPTTPPDPPRPTPDPGRPTPDPNKPTPDPTDPTIPIPTPDPPSPTPYVPAPTPYVPEPTATPVPVEPTPIPTAEPTPVPTAVPTVEPTVAPTIAPTPTAAPTAAPTPIILPTVAPIVVPTHTPVPTTTPEDTVDTGETTETTDTTTSVVVVEEVTDITHIITPTVTPKVTPTVIPTTTVTPSPIAPTAEPTRKPTKTPDEPKVVEEVVTPKPTKTPATEDIVEEDDIEEADVIEAAPTVDADMTRESLDADIAETSLTGGRIVFDTVTRGVSRIIMARSPGEAILKGLWPVGLLLLLLIARHMMWYGAFLPESKKGIVKIIKRQKNKNNDFITMQTIIDEAVSSGEGIESIRHKNKKTKCISLVAITCKMQLSIDSPLGNEVSRVFSASEAKLYDLLSDYEDRDCIVTVKIYKKNIDEAVELKYSFGNKNWDFQKAFDTTVKKVEFDKI